MGIIWIRIKYWINRFSKKIKEIDDFELINENNDIFSDDTFLNIKNNIYNLYKEKAINVNEINNLNIKSIQKVK